MKKQFLLLGLILFVAVGCNKAQAPIQQEEVQQTEQSSGEPGETKEFSKTYRTGFEENVFSLNYKLSYPSGYFMVSNEGNNNSRILIKEIGGDKTNYIDIFNNDGAGFASVAEFFKEKKYCLDCKKVVNPKVSLKDAKLLEVYENANQIWYVYAHDPGFVAMMSYKPNDKVLPVFQSFELSAVLIE
jgi:hypothetical protein